MKQGFNTNPCKTRQTKDSAIDKEDHFKVLPTADPCSWSTSAGGHLEQQGWEGCLVPL